MVFHLRFFFHLSTDFLKNWSTSFTYMNFFIIQNKNWRKTNSQGPLMVNNYWSEFYKHTHNVKYEYRKYVKIELKSFKLNFFQRGHVLWLRVIVKICVSQKSVTNLCYPMTFSTWKEIENKSLFRLEKNFKDSNFIIPRWFCGK